jgi:hypothetical protein
VKRVPRAKIALAYFSKAPRSKNLPAPSYFFNNQWVVRGSGPWLSVGGDGGWGCVRQKDSKRFLVVGQTIMEAEWRAEGREKTRRESVKARGKENKF